MPLAGNKIPKAAMRLRVGTVTFAAPAEGDATATEGKGVVPVKMVARTGQPIEHWFFGKVAHDLAGMTVHKDRLPIDYAHFDDEVIGYLDKFDIATGDLVVTGALVPFTDDDRASEVVFKAKAGVPYEASINFCGDGITLEEVGPNASAEVNGYEFTGPGVIVRQWPLRGVAVCPYGADANTTTEFKGGGESVAVTLLKGATVTDEDKKAADEKAAEDKKAEDEKKAADDKAAEEKKASAEDDEDDDEEDAKDKTEAAKHSQKLKKFIGAFGDVGGRWFAEGRKFSACVGEFTSGLQEKHKAEVDAKDKEIARLTAVVEATPRGDKGVGFNAGGGAGGTTGAKQQFTGLSENTARFAAGIKMPGQN